MNAYAITLARYRACKAVERELQAQGLKIAHVERRIIVAAANAYLAEHPELIEEAAETVRNHPRLRTLAEQDERRRKGNR
jgi:hypothetical protein